MKRTDCWKCGGFGILRLDHNATCPECRGEGKTFIRDRSAADINADIDARHDWLARTIPPHNWRAHAVRHLIVDRRNQGRSYLWIIKMLQEKEAQSESE